jgi:hypothetical protein
MTIPGRLHLAVVDRTGWFEGADNDAKIGPVRSSPILFASVCDEAGRGSGSHYGGVVGFVI